MTALKQQFGKVENLLRAIEAASNWRALLMLFGTLLIFALLNAAGAATGSMAVIGFTLLIGLVVLITGLSATGYMLMDQARGIAMRRPTEAILAAVFTLHRLVGAALLIILILVVALLLVALLLLPCKIPGLGPLLYAVVYPLSATFLGILLLSLFVVGPVILLPAIWEGNGVIPAMARLWTISRNNLLLVVLNLLLLSLVVAIIGGVLFGIVLAGSATTIALAVPIIGYQAGMGFMAIFSSLMAMMSGFGESGSGYLTAILFGALLLNVVVACIPVLIWLSGACHIYLQSAAGLDFEAAESRINQGMAEAKRRAQEAQARAQQAADQARAAANAAAASSAPVAEPQNMTQATQAPVCPKCNTPVAADDVFCGGCGHRLGA